MFLTRQIPGSIDGSAIAGRLLIPSFPLLAYVGCVGPSCYFSGGTAISLGSGASLAVIRCCD